MLEQIPGTKQVTVGGEKAFDTADFVAECRNLKVTPRGPKHGAARWEAIDARTTQHAGYAISQRKRKRIEECFGWLKTIALLRKVWHRGIFKVGWIFTLAAAAYNLEPVTKLSEDSLPNQCPITRFRIAIGTSPGYRSIRVKGRYVVAVRGFETRTARCGSSDPAQPLALVRFGSESGSQYFAHG
jgi:hypothetical protein